ncbi:hypothetical protein FSARC_11852 [Fusarium sarcochroum]|uniref:Uncharacterized protein n=1 Tax=Fusarium sarcochroum TaxID=1208366 RepID=A0A8H4TCE4_9HYPO|nr:hypothetical protein FSARC_11852 [Fusarium sarcochroum]
MLSHAKLHQLESVPSNVKSNWLNSIQTRPIRSGSVSSDDGAPPASVIHNLALDEDMVVNAPARSTIFEHGNRTDAMLSYREHDLSGSTTRHVSQAMSTVSKRDFSFGSSSANSLYDTQAIWKQGRDFVSDGIPFELDTHM